MSRIGKQTIYIPEKATVTISGNHIKATGPMGESELLVPDVLTVIRQDDQINITRKNDEKTSRSLHGLYRVLTSNLIEGVEKGFSKSLEFKGIGYRVAVADGKVTLNVGYSHQVELIIPEGLSVESKKSTITVIGNNKYQVGEFAAKIRAVRKPEVYKGKGIRYSDERIRIKPGKTAAKG